MYSSYPSTIISLLWLLAALLLSACSSSGGDTTAPSALVTPDSGSIINAGTSSVVIRFSESMDTSSIVLGGSMAADSDGGTWSTTTVANDTVTISPTDGWSTGNATLTVAANDVAGNALSPINLAYPIPLMLNTFQPASIVIGQADFTSGTQNQGGTVDANTLYGPVAAPSPGSLYLADQVNHRVLGFNAIPVTNNANADFVIGQADFTTATPGVAADKLNQPVTAVTADGRLFVADSFNHRVLIWNSRPTGNVPPDIVLGQPDFTSNMANQGGAAGANTMNLPIGVSVVGGRLIVSDLSNNRVLIWNSIPTSNNTPADIVLGQADFSGTAANRGGLLPAANTLNQPLGIWSDGQRLAVTDAINNRVLVWNPIPTTNGTDADLVIGQPDFTSMASGSMSQSLFIPQGVYSNGLQLFISDSSNHRVLIYDSFPTANQPAAARVLGQDGFPNAAPNDDNQDGAPDANPTERTLEFPNGVIAIGNRLFVTDFGNHRVLAFGGN